jgi:hypothetical protein
VAYENRRVHHRHRGVLRRHPCRHRAAPGTARARQRCLRSINQQRQSTGACRTCATAKSTTLSATLAAQYIAYQVTVSNKGLTSLSGHAPCAIGDSARPIVAHRANSPTGSISAKPFEHQLADARRAPTVKSEHYFTDRLPPFVP